VIIASIDDKFTGIQISLLFAPIWMVRDLRHYVESIVNTVADGLLRHPVGHPYFGQVP